MSLDLENRLPLDEVRAYIDGMDFTPTFEKLISDSIPVPYSRPWDPEAAINAIHRYRNYLFLWRKYKYESEDTVDVKMPPPPDVDEIWHSHILDTRRYSADCALIFGTFHHHYPYFGRDNDEVPVDWAQIRQAFEPVSKMYMDEFDDVLVIPTPGID